MKYDEFKRQLGKAGLSIKAFTALVNVSSNTITNYKKHGIVPSHWAIVALLMGEMADHGLNFRDVLSRIDIEPNKVRGAAAKGRFGGSRQSDLQI